MKKCDKCGKIIRVGFENYVNVFSDGFKSYHYDCFRDMVLQSANQINNRSKNATQPNVLGSQINLDVFQEVKQ